MVILTTPLLTAIALLSAISSAAPSKRDSSTNEPAFSAPGGVLESDAPAPTPVVAGASYGSNYGSNTGSNYGSSNNWNSGSSNSYSGSDSSNNNWNSDSNSGSYSAPSSNSWNSGSNSYSPPSNEYSPPSNNYSPPSNGYDSNSNTWNSDTNTWESGSYNTVDSWDSSSVDTWVSTSTTESWSTATADTWTSTTTVVEYAAAATSAVWTSATTEVAAASATYGSSWGSSGSSYGSGSSNWGTDYNSCVSQCQAQWNMLPPPATVTAPPSSGSGSSWDSGSYNGGGTPTTHTVIVAPSQGVLRMVPLAVNASVGDTISWQWHAGPHTVTKSSEAAICNKTTDNPFASGQQNASFVFNQVINDTNPIFYYCGVPGHCEKGMFGIVNAPASFEISTSLETQILSAAASSPALNQMLMAVNNMTAGTSAYNWGAGFDMSAIPAENQMAFYENTLYTRMFYSANNGSLEAGQGAFSPTGAALVYPPDLSTLVSAVGNTDSSSSSSSSSSAAAPTNTGAYSAAMGQNSGAPHVAVSGSVLAIVALVGAILAA